MTKFLLAGAAGAALICGTAAIAQPAAQPAAKVQARTAVQAQVAKQFARIDTNRDGFVTKAEVDAIAATRGQKVAATRNPGAMFDRLDANRDGSITRAEFDASRTQRQQRVATRDKDGDGRPDARRMGQGRRMGVLGGRMFEMADANRDSRVSLQEATEAAIRRFDTVDANRDGQITPQERQQSRERMRAQRQPG